ncbi:uncharacterized protein LOC143462328 [Clavelina lepadiformis]|uniref:uncharacterized protein LOC143462328 n=1 Tax=Clavelina lepadiformis TaxID=159417 RepID=UPI0040433C96
MILNKVLKGLASTMENFIFAAKTGNLSAHPSVADKRSKIKWKRFIGQKFKVFHWNNNQLCNFILMDFSVQYEHFTSTNGIYSFSSDTCKIFQLYFLFASFINWLS